MEFRKACVQDVDAIESIYDAIHDAEAEGIVTTGWLRGIYPVRQTALSAIERGDLFVGEETDAEGNKEIFGSAVINQIQVDVYEGAPWQKEAADDEVMVLHCLTIDPAKYGKGYGSAFAKFYEEYACENGCVSLRIDTNEKNLRARKMYASLGYTEIDIVPTVFNGIPNVMLVMLEKPL